MCLMVISCIGLSWVPHKSLRAWLYERVALTVFRCFSRSFSGQYLCNVGLFPRDIYL